MALAAQPVVASWKERGVECASKAPSIFLACLRCVALNVLCCRCVGQSIVERSANCSFGHAIAVCNSQFFRLIVVASEKKKKKPSNIRTFCQSPDSFGVSFEAESHSFNRRLQARSVCVFVSSSSHCLHACSTAAWRRTQQQTRYAIKTTQNH